MLAPVLLMTLGIASAQSVGGAALAEPTRVPGGILDAAGAVVYMRQMTSGIVAVDAQSGMDLWQRTDLPTPHLLVEHQLLALVDDQLLVLAGEPCKPNVLRVHFLDVKAKGVCVRESEITLPDWVELNGGPDPYCERRHFDTHAENSGDELHVQWKFSTSYCGGAPPPPEILARSRRSAAGTAKIDLSSGAVVMLADEWKEPTMARLTPVDQLPEPVRSTARRESWGSARLAGRRAYGHVGDTSSSTHNYILRVVDIETGKPLWSRTYAKFQFRPPPP